MALPNSRASFKSYVLRKLGNPVHAIEVTDDQLEDRIDDALTMFANFHFEGAQRTYYKYQLTAQDLVNKYITLPENIIGAVKVFPYDTLSVASGDLFNINYQIALSELYFINSFELAPYFMKMQHISLMQEILAPEIPIRYSRHSNILHLDTNWAKLREGQYMIVEAFQVIDPSVYPDVWKDNWLLAYGTALVRLQWADNLSKYDLPLPGGNRFNAQLILNRAEREVEKLERELRDTYSAPPLPFLG